MEPKVILGLSMNTRMLGLAIISGNHLMDYHIQLRKETWTLRKKELIVASLVPWCESYSIKNIALSTSYEKQTSTQTKELFESLKSHCSKKKINIFSYHAKTLHQFCEEAKTKAKKEIMKMLALKYPELSYYYQKEMRNKNKYYIKLFEAVGVATIHSQRIQGK